MDEIADILSTIKEIQPLEEIITKPDDIDDVLRAVSHNPNAFQFASERLKKDPEFVLQILAMSIDAYPHIDISLQTNQLFTEQLVLEIPKVFARLHDSMKNDEDIALLAIQMDKTMMHHIGTSLRMNWNFMLLAIQIKSESFTVAHNTLKKDIDFINASIDARSEVVKFTKFSSYAEERQSLLRAIRHNAVVYVQLKFISRYKKHVSDPEFVHTAVEYGDHNFTSVPKEFQTKELALLHIKTHTDFESFAEYDYENFSPKLQSDRDVVLAIVTYGSLEPVDVPFRKDVEFVMPAVKRDGMDLKYALEPALLERPIVVIAVSQDGMALQYAPEQYKKDAEIVRIAVRQNGNALQFADDTLRTDFGIILDAVQNDGLALTFARFQNEDTARVAVRQNGLSLQFVDEQLQSEDITTYAVIRDGMSLQYASPDMKNNSDIVTFAVLQNGHALQFVSLEIRNNIKMMRITFMAVTQNGEALQHASASFKQNRSVVLQAVRQNGNAIQYATPEFRLNANIGVVAVEKTPASLRFVDKTIQRDVQRIVRERSRIAERAKFILTLERGVESAKIPEAMRIETVPGSVTVTGKQFVSNPKYRPFYTEKQRRYMWWKHPKIARKRVEKVKRAKRALRAKKEKRRKK